MDLAVTGHLYIKIRKLKSKHSGEISSFHKSFFSNGKGKKNALVKDT